MRAAPAQAWLPVGATGPKFLTAVGADPATRIPAPDIVSDFVFASL